jgi:pimeloyl-ACP methyl ester carboxylesterase
MLRRVLSSAASQVDRAFTNVIVARSRTNPVARGETLGHDDRMLWLEKIHAIYGDERHVHEPDGFFGPRGELEPEDVAVRSFARGGRVVDLLWRSRSTVFCDDVAPIYGACRANHTVTARLFLHNDRPRPTAILVHGYLGGHFAFEEKVWPMSWFFERGLDLALAVLPFHGVRADGARKGSPIFPGSDPRVTVEGFRQAVIDLRDLVSLLQARGAPAVGIMGMSLGGYTTALMATLEPRLAFAVPMIPLASLADFAREQGRLVGTLEEQDLQWQALERAHSVVSPLRRTPRIDADRMLVLAAEGDSITPIEHARRIATHLDAPLETFVGGHLLQFGRGAAFRSFGRLVGRLGLLDPR